MRLARQLERFPFERGKPHEFLDEAGQLLAVAVDRLDRRLLEGREFFGFFQQHRRKPADGHQRRLEFVRNERQEIFLQLRFLALFGHIGKNHQVPGDLAMVIADLIDHARQDERGRRLAHKLDTASPAEGGISDQRA